MDIRQEVVMNFILGSSNNIVITLVMAVNSVLHGPFDS